MTYELYFLNKIVTKAVGKCNALMSWFIFNDTVPTTDAAWFRIRIHRVTINSCKDFRRKVITCTSGTNEHHAALRNDPYHRHDLFKQVPRQAVIFISRSKFQTALIFCYVTWHTSQQSEFDLRQRSRGWVCGPAYPMFSWFRQHFLPLDLRTLRWLTDAWR